MPSPDCSLEKQNEKKNRGESVVSHPTILYQKCKFFVNIGNKKSLYFFLIFFHDPNALRYMTYSVIMPVPYSRYRPLYFPGYIASIVSVNIGHS